MNGPPIPIPELSSEEIVFVNEFVGPPIENGCQPWLGTGGIMSTPYTRPTVKLRGRTWQAYRITYTIGKGPIPDGLVIDHLCAWAKCVNPEHLEPVTQSENKMRDGPRYQARLVARAQALRAMILASQEDDPLPLDAVVTSSQTGE